MKTLTNWSVGISWLWVWSPWAPATHTHHRIPSVPLSTHLQPPNVLLSNLFNLINSLLSFSHESLKHRFVALFQPSGALGCVKNSVMLWLCLLHSAVCFYNTQYELGQGNLQWGISLITWSYWIIFVVLFSNFINQADTQLHWLGSAHATYWR